MQTITKSVEDTTNHLIEICRDGEKGFAAASNAIKNDVLKREFMQYSRERAGFAVALGSALKDIGGEPKDHSTASGAIHRGVIHLMKISPGDNEHAVLAACERGEDAAVKAYSEAIQAMLSGQLGSLVSTQYQ